ncbi:MAG: glycerol-3-phosphate 1-O-acyltransferase [Gammaproteobacteria bacterium]|nr:glycerol-3-phosphate 1-O-acyltransferase [Gammaproteobacteria bacterium]
MAVNSWQQTSAPQVLILLDAAHQIEEGLLRDWVQQGQSEYKGEVHYVLVPIAHNPEDIPTEALAASLDVDPKTLLVPVRVVWKTPFDTLSDKPRLRDLLRGDPRHPGEAKARKLLQQNPDAATPIAGAPATLADLQQRFEERRKNASVDKDLADFVANQASLALDVVERRLRGSRYKVPRLVARQIRASDRYKQGLGEIAHETGQTEEELRSNALPIFKELISRPQIFWQDVLASFNRKLIGHAYGGQVIFDQSRLDRFRQIVREHPTALLWTHKTHMDGIAMQHVLFDNDFPTPHTVGGINMAFAGLGFVARRAGAIFIRRSFQDDLLYKLILRNYLAYLLEKRFPLTWAFEGTRSRVGKLMPPRYGILKYVMEAMRDSTADQLYIIPIAINYDMINDVKDYAAEQAGAIKRPESLSWAISYVRRMRHPLGRIYIDFGEPVVVDRNAIEDDNLSLAKTAFRVGVEANRVTPITLTSLMSLYLLGTSPRAQTLEELRGGMAQLVAWARQREIRLSDDFELQRAEQTLELVDAMERNGLLNRYDEGPETVYAIADDQHMVASYYRNTIVHHFVAKAIAELALVHAITREQDRVAAFWAEADELRDMFKFEFFYSPTEQFNNEVRAELARYEPDWENKLEAEEDFAPAFLRELAPLVAHATLRPYIESYRIVADVFSRLQPGQTLDIKHTVAESFKYGRQAYMQRRISSKASIGDILFKNAFKLMESYKLTGTGDETIVNQRKQLSKRLRLLSHRIAQLRTFSMPSEF